MNADDSVATEKYETFSLNQGLACVFFFYSRFQGRLILWNVDNVGKGTIVN